MTTRLPREILPLLHEVEYRLAFVGFETFQRRPVRPERADACRNDDRPRFDDGAERGLDAEAPGLESREAHDLLVEVVYGMEGGRLRRQVRDQVHRRDLRVSRNVVDRFLRIQRRALTAQHIKRIDDMALHLQHAAFEHREQADRPGPYDQNVSGMERHDFLAYSPQP